MGERTSANLRLEAGGPSAGRESAPPPAFTITLGPSNGLYLTASVVGPGVTVNVGSTYRDRAALIALAKTAVLRRVFGDGWEHLGEADTLAEFEIVEI